MQTCTIQIHFDAPEIVYYNPWQIGYIGAQKIAFGLQCSECLFIPKEHLKHEIELSEALCNQIFIQENTVIHFIADQDCLYFGPLLGIFTTGFPEKEQKPILNERTIFFEKLLRLQTKLGAVSFLFGPGQICWETGTIQGFFYHDKEGWIQKKIGFPTAIYNRLPNRYIETSPRIKQIKNTLQSHYGIPIFNPNFFDKVSFFQALSRFTETMQYLPKTVIQPNTADIFTFLHTHTAAYIKPIHQSAGIGIVKCFFRKETGLYYAGYYKNDKPVFRAFDNLETLLEETVFKQNTTNHLIQADIGLQRLNGIPFDFRVHTNRDENGDWKVTAFAVKLAAKGAPTTHTKYGGKVQPLELLPFPIKKKRRLREKIYQAVLQMSQIIEKEYSGYIGEIGFDIGIDHKEKVWLLEGNAKPGRAIFQHPLLVESEETSLSSIYLFAYYLLKQSVKQPDLLLENLLNS